MSEPLSVLLMTRSLTYETFALRYYARFPSDSVVQVKSFQDFGGFQRDVRMNRRNFLFMVDREFGGRPITELLDDLKQAGPVLGCVKDVTGQLLFEGLKMPCIWVADQVQGSHDVIDWVTTEVVKSAEPALKELEALLDIIPEEYIQKYLQKYGKAGSAHAGDVEQARERLNFIHEMKGNGTNEDLQGFKRFLREGPTRRSRPPRAVNRN